MTNQQRNMTPEQQAADRRAGILALITTLIIVGLIIALPFACSAGGSSSSYDRLTCQSCGRTVELGNNEYYTIKRTNMCDNCYAHFQWAQNALGN